MKIYDIIYKCFKICNTNRMPYFLIHINLYKKKLFIILLIIQHKKFVAKNIFHLYKIKKIFSFYSKYFHSSVPILITLYSKTKIYIFKQHTTLIQ